MTQELKNEINIMLDLETIGTTYNSGILSIGAVPFLGVADILPTFYEKCSYKHLLAAGFHYDTATMNWWDRQEQKVKDEAFSGTMTPVEMLLRFTEYLKLSFDKDATILMWGNGADFDNTLLADMHDRLGVRLPWNFRNNRCFRTLKHLTQVPAPAFQGDKHNALADAKHQALWAEEIFKHLSLHGVYSR